MIDGHWGVIANSWTAVIVAVCVVATCVGFNIHTNDEGRLSQERLLAIITLSISIYTFTVLSFCQIAEVGPRIDVLIRDGFKGDRVAWLLAAVLFTQGIRLWAAIHDGRLDTKKYRDKNHRK